MAEASAPAAGRVARNGAILLLAKVAATVAGLVSLPVLYGRLGERTYGVWALLTGILAVAALADMGLGSAQVREVARAADGGDRRPARAALALGLVWAVCLGGPALLGTAVCWPWLARVFHLGELAGPARDALLLLVTGFVLDSLAMPWRAVLEGTQRYGPVGWATAGTAVAGALLAVLLVLLGGGLVQLAASVAVTSAVRTCLLVAAARRHAPELAPRLRDVRRADLTVIGGYGLRLQVTNAAAAVNNETDRLVLAGFLGPPAAAGFDLGGKLANTLRLPPWIMLTAVFPAAAALAAEEGRERLDRLYLTATRYTTVFAAVGAAALVASADPLVRLWIGHPVPFAVVTLALLAPGYAVNLACVPASVVARAEGRPGCETRYAVLAAALNLVTTVPLLRLLGPRGVPLSTTAAASVATVYFFARFHRLSMRPFRPVLDALWPPMLAAALAGAVTWTAGPVLPDGPSRADAALAVVCRGALTVALAAVALAALRYFDASDRVRLRTAAAGVLRRPLTTPLMNRRSPKGGFG